jgi:glucose-1-phosphate thymidylyltransferase
MKGVILAGGKGTRLLPLTKVTSKQLLPVYNKPMIYYPLFTLLKADIKDILFITSPEHSGDFIELLGSGDNFNASFSYIIQDEPKGLAHALNLAKHFAENQPVCMILGDNIFEDNLSSEIQKFKSPGAKIFIKKVDNPERFGVAEVDQNGNVIKLVEKPKNPKSNLAQTGLYLYDSKVFEYIKKLKPSERGELEITDLNNNYLERKELSAQIIKGQWIDAGTFESLFMASKLVKDNNYLKNL